MREKVIDSARELGLDVHVRRLEASTATAEDAAVAADGADLVLCMSIEPCYSGQAFMPEAFGRIERLRDRPYSRGVVDT